MAKSTLSQCSEGKTGVGLWAHSLPMSFKRRGFAGALMAVRGNTPGGEQLAGLADVCHALNQPAAGRHF